MSFVSTSRGNDNSQSVNDEMLTKVEASNSIVVRKAYVQRWGGADTKTKRSNWGIKIIQVSQPTPQWWFLLLQMVQCFCRKGDLHCCNHYLSLSCLHGPSLPITQHCHSVLWDTQVLGQANLLLKMHCKIDYPSFPFFSLIGSSDCSGLFSLR